jgi:hypothetical protein
VINKALSLNLDQAAIDDFFAQPDIQGKIRNKAWYTGRVVATNIPTAGNNSITANNPTTANVANEEDEPFNLAEAHVAGYMLDVEEAV